MRPSRVQMPFILLATAVGILSNNSASANHRRHPYVYRAAPGQMRPCHPVFMNAGVGVQPQMTMVQPAPIPPALVPIMMTIGQDLSGIAIEQLLALLRRKIEERGYSWQIPEEPGTEAGLNSTLEDLANRLDRLEGRFVDMQDNSNTVGSARRGSIPLPTDVTPRDFPVFR
jgi:hypothetical protein